MVRLATAVITFLGLASPALAQFTSTPGPGGIPFAPGAPPAGYTPGGVGISGSRIAPGPAAAGIPMERRAPGGVPVLVTPQGNAAGTAPAAASAAPAATASLAPCTHRGCLPGGLALTIDSRDVVPAHAATSEITTMRTLQAALRACWMPPALPQDEAQMSVRFSFRRSGELIGPPFVTFASRGLSAQIREDVRGAITSAFDHCAPFKLSQQFAAAIAGQPISVRFVDHR